MNYFKNFCVVLTVLNLNDFTGGEKIAKQKLMKNPNICQYQPNGALLANPDDCHKFYLCVQQQPLEYNCNMDYHYDATMRNCVKGTKCTSKFNKTLSCTEGNIRAVQDDCNVFEACVQGEYQKLNCPPNYYFNAQKSICVPFKYDIEYKCNCLMPEYTVLENKNNCETYFVCHHKTAVLESCPLGQYYSARLNTCILDLEGVCLMKPTIMPILSENDVEAKCTDLGLKNIHFQTFAKGCNTFYSCVNGQLFTQHCPKDSYYDSDKKYCITDGTRKCVDSEDFVIKNYLN